MDKDFLCRLTWVSLPPSKRCYLIVNFEKTVLLFPLSSNSRTACDGREQGKSQNFIAGGHAAETNSNAAKVKAFL